MGPLPPDPFIQDRFTHMLAHPRWQRLGWLYLVMGLVWCALCVGPMAALEFGYILVGAAFLLSLDVEWQVLKSWFRQPLVLLIMAWVAWMALSLTWSLDP